MRIRSLRGPEGFEGDLNTDNEGLVGRPVEIDAEDGVGSLYVPSGVKALDRNDRPLIDIYFRRIENERLPAVPAGAAFQFAGYVYEAGPGGATFDPGITLTLEIPEVDWNTLALTGQQLTLKWYNQSANAWEDVPTTVNSDTRTVRATITHFTIFALFTEPVTTAAPTETAAAATTTTTPGEEPPAEGLPVTTILFVVVIVAIIVGAGHFFIVKKK